MNSHIDRSLTQLQLLQELQQQTFIECLAHNLILIGQTIWADRTNPSSLRQEFLTTLHSIHLGIFTNANELLEQHELRQLLLEAADASPQLIDLLLEAIEESYQTARVA